MLSGALDAHLDHYDSITTGHISQALHYLNIGKITSSRRPLLTRLVFFWSLLAFLFATMPALRSGNHHSQPVRGSCQFTVYNYCSALYR